MSKSSKTNTSSTQNTAQTVSQTPTNPQFVTDAVTGVQNNINGLLAADPQSYVAPASALQTQAFTTGASGLGGWQPGMTAAQGATTGLLGEGVTPQQAGTTQATSGTLLDTDLSRYQNPNLQAVVNTTLADADQNAAMVRAAQAASLARDQKFSGSGSAITSALTEGQLARARASADANLRSQAFDNAQAAATGDLNRSAATSAFNAGQANNTSQFNAGQTNSLAEQDLQRKLSAAGLLGDLSSSQGANSRADLGSLLSTGDDQRSIASQQASAPLTVAGLISALQAQQPYSLFHGSTGTADGTTSTNGTSTTKDSGASLADWLNYFSSNAKAVASAGGG